MEAVDVRMRRQKRGWIGHTLGKDKKCIARKAIEWNPLISAERLPGRPRQTWRRTVARESKIIGKSWNELKALLITERVRRQAIFCKILHKFKVIQNNFIKINRFV